MYLHFFLQIEDDSAIYHVELLRRLREQIQESQVHKVYVLILVHLALLQQRSDTGLFLKSRNSFLTIMEPEKFKVKELSDGYIFHTVEERAHSHNSSLQRN